MRHFHSPNAFHEYEDIIHTMLHELCHCNHGSHNHLFYALLDALHVEYKELMRKGITGKKGGSSRSVAAASRPAPFVAPPAP